MSALRALGAVDYLIKPVSTQQLTTMFGALKKTAQFEKVLVIDTDPEVGKKVHDFMAGRCEITSVSSAAEAREAIKDNIFASIVLELDLPDESGDSLLKSLKEEYGDSLPPVIINTSEAIDRERYAFLGGNPTLW